MGWQEQWSSGACRHVQQEGECHLTQSYEPLGEEDGIGQRSSSPGGSRQQQGTGRGGGTSQDQKSGPAKRPHEPQMTSGPAGCWKGEVSDLLHHGQPQIGGGNYPGERFQRLEGPPVALHASPAGTAGQKVNADSSGCLPGELLLHVLRKHLDDSGAGFHQLSSLFRRISRARKRRFFTVPRGRCFTLAMSS